MILCLDFSARNPTKVKKAKAKAKAPKKLFTEKDHGKRKTVTKGKAKSSNKLVQDRTPKVTRTTASK